VKNESISMSRSEARDDMPGVRGLQTIPIGHGKASTHAAAVVPVRLALGATCRRMTILPRACRRISRRVSTSTVRAIERAMIVIGSRQAAGAPRLIASFLCCNAIECSAPCLLYSLERCSQRV
jgi:hypothetical protein